MSGGMPEMLISRHVTRLMEQWPQEQVQELLRRSDLEQASGLVRKRSDGLITMEDCFRYKEHVREMFGDEMYEFARVNFILGGCRCSACKSETNTPSPPSGPPHRRGRTGRAA